jgi:hypothetical protein
MIAHKKPLLFKKILLTQCNIVLNNRYLLRLFSSDEQTNKEYDTSINYDHLSTVESITRKIRRYLKLNSYQYIVINNQKENLLNDRDYFVDTMTHNPAVILVTIKEHAD